MKTRRVLLVCYYFPPLGGAGVGRPLALFKHLPQYGYECDVLTVKPVAYRVFEPELIDGLDTDRIYRSPSWDPQRLLYLLGFRTVGERFVRRSKAASPRFFPDSKTGWVRPAVRLGLRLAAQKRYDAIISTSPPISSHLVGRRLADATGLPWIADFRDYWTSYRIEDEFADKRSIERAWRLLDSITGASPPAAITTVNQAIADYIGQGEVIYNSFDSETSRLWKPPTEGSAFTIGLLGTFDELVPVEPLLRVIAAIRDSEPGLLNKLRLLQVGRVESRRLEALLSRYGLLEICDRLGFRSRRESVQLLSQASLLYVGLSPSAQGVLPGRLYDQLASGRPILAAVPAGSEAGRLIAGGGNGYCFDDGDTASINSAADFLAGQLRLWETGRLTITPLSDYARQFSAERMAEKFARVIGSLGSHRA